MRQRLLIVFQAECKEHLEKIRSHFDAYGAGLHGAELDDAFRRAHSLKGAARAVDIKAIETVAHRMETLLAKTREGGITLGEDHLRILFRCLDSIEDSLSDAISGKASVEPTEIIAEIDRLIQDAKPVTSAPAKERFAPPPDRGVLYAPSAREAEESDVARPASSKSITDKREETGLAPAGESSASGDYGEMIRVRADHLDRLVKTAGALLSENLKQSEEFQELQRINQEMMQFIKDWRRVRESSLQLIRDLSMRSDSASLGRFLEKADHEFNAFSKSMHRIQRQRTLNAWSLKRSTESLEEETRLIRLTPAESVYDGFRKMIRDLARDEGKEIDFKIAGLNVEAERETLQTLKDPIMHALRNAVSHGIESPPERRRRGKSPVGAVSLQIRHQSNNLEIAVSDDGRGLDFEKIKKIGLQKGYLSESQMAEITPSELSRLIFSPGFTTSDAVTDLQGRGMGLSVVYEEVHRLQGDVEIRRGESAGLEIVLIVPLSLTTRRLILAECQNQIYGFSMNNVEKMVRLKKSAVRVVENRMMTLYEGEMIPLASLAQLLNYPQPNLQSANDLISCLVLKWGAERMIVAVDRWVNQLNAMVHSLGEPLSRIEKASGGIFLGDGSVAIVLYVPALFDSYKKMEGVTALSAREERREERKNTILVVDDSITTRTLEKSILESNGYSVHAVVDGIEALNYLRTASVDLVIADIEMPRLDGFGLLQELKSAEEWSKIPVILVTSVERPESKERGLNLGADAYIVKRRFDQQELLDAIEQIL